MSHNITGINARYSLGNSGLSPSDMGLIYIFGFIPSLTAANTMTGIYCVIVCITLFMSNMVRIRGAGSTSCCLRCCFGKLKICHFTTVLPGAAIIELIGYGARRDMILQFGAWSYLFSQISILIAPVILAIMNYKAVCRLLAAAELHVFCLSPATLGSIIVFVDVTCAVLQFGGGVCATLAIAFQNQLVTDIGNYLLLFSFILQLLLNFAFTMLIRWMFLQPKFAPSKSPIPHMTKFWTTMWSTVGLLWIRNIYRAAESFATIGRSKAFALESLFYALDTVPVLLCFLVFIWGHYGISLPLDDGKDQLLTAVEVVDGNIINGSPRSQSVIPAREGDAVANVVHIQMEEEV